MIRTTSAQQIFFFVPERVCRKTCPLSTKSSPRPRFSRRSGHQTTSPRTFPLASPANSRHHLRSRLRCLLRCPRHCHRLLTDHHLNFRLLRTARTVSFARSNSSSRSLIKRLPLPLNLPAPPRPRPRGANRIAGDPRLRRLAPPRLLYNHAHTALKARLPRTFHAPAVLLFNPGFFACAPQPGDVLLYDAAIHASVHDGARAPGAPG